MNSEDDTAGAATNGDDQLRWYVLKVQSNREKSIREKLQGLPEVPGIFAAVPYCIDLIGGPYIETHESVVKAFRPKSAMRKRSP